MIVWTFFFWKIFMKVFVSLLAQKLRHQMQIYDVYPIRKFWESASINISTALILTNHKKALPCKLQSFAVIGWKISRKSKLSIAPTDWCSTVDLCAKKKFKAKFKQK